MINIYEIKRLPQVPVGAETHDQGQVKNRNRRSRTLLLMDSTMNDFVTDHDHHHQNQYETDLARETMMTTILVVDDGDVSLALQERDQDLVMMMIVLTKSRRKRVMMDQSLLLRNRRERDPYLVTTTNGQIR